MMQHNGVAVEKSYAPLQDLKFSGLHLIEASAGTGKTWTLSSLLVRILTEKYLPRDIIATTFTRAAAAELKTRIRQRLVEVQKKLPEWMHAQQQQAHSALQALLAQDPLFEVLYAHHQQDLLYLQNRLKLVLNTSDELFVGTIDSFTQKLLREFSFESGEIMPRDISDQEQYYPYVIAHDALRAWIQQQPQGLIDLILLTGSFKHVDEYLNTIGNALNFSRAYLQPVQSPELSIATFSQLYTQTCQLNAEDLADLESYYLPDGALIGRWNGRSWKKGAPQAIATQLIPQFIRDLKDLGQIVLFNAQYQTQHAIEGKKSKTINEVVQDFCQLAKCEKFSVDEVTTFTHHPVIQTLNAFLVAVDELKQQLKQLNLYLAYHLSVEVKKRLPQLLQQAGETTFSQQIRGLTDALMGEKGQRLARVIQHRYPLILVDEFQDTNQDQDDMLRLIWRDPQRFHQGCFIAVGDPKQAIYGFRGGDMLTYTNAYHQMRKLGGKLYSLHYNHRSIPSLVSAVDTLFQRQSDFLEHVKYEPVSAGRQHYAVLKDAHQDDPAPLRFLHVPEKGDEAQLISEKIRHLLWQAEQGELYIFDAKTQQQRPICADDIAVLAMKNRDLDRVQKRLEKMSIVVSRNALSSVFSSPVAQYIHSILNAVFNPEKENILKRALLSPCIGLTLSDFIAFEQSPEQLSFHIEQFRQCRQLWLEQGFLVAWQWLLARYHIWQRLAEQSADQAERAVVNLRHLTEILSHNSWQYQGIQHLIQWYEQQLKQPLQREWELERKLSSEAGVQLMTIHKSKGLEFKIVFLMQADKQPSSHTQKESLGFYQQHDANGQIQRAITISDQLLDEATRRAHDEKLQAEDHRLWYVALTRASYRMYLCFCETKPAKNPRLMGVPYWLDAQEQAYQHAASMDEPVQTPVHVLKKQLADDAALSAQPLPTLKVYSKGRTSFSALAQHLTQHAMVDQLAEVDLDLQPAEDETEQAQVAMPTTTTTQALWWIQQHFPRGTHAGNCLHGLFEHLDFQDPDQWPREVFIGLSQYQRLWDQLAQQYQQAFDLSLSLNQARQACLELVLTWIEAIVHTPMQGHTLAQVSCAQKLPEFPFFMALADRRFNSHGIYQLFAEQQIIMPEFNEALAARYLNGAIDLVYHDGQRFHVADYKSNFLGDHLEDYNSLHLAENMSSSSYYLQAAIYLVALHRYLQRHLADYQINQHLGDAHYLYLRGMQINENYGVLNWRPSDEFILQLDALLGVPVHQSAFAV